MSSEFDGKFVKKNFSPWKKLFSPIFFKIQNRHSSEGLMQNGPHGALTMFVQVACLFS